MPSFDDEFKFPDEKVDDKSVESDEVEITIVDDTPERDRGRKPLDREVADPTDEEIESYSDGVKKRISELTHARHDERRAKEALAREKAELERFAQQLLQENKNLKQSSTKMAITAGENEASAKLEKARRDLRAAQESFDTDAIISAQEELAQATWELNMAKVQKNSLQAEESDVQTTHRAAQTQQQPQELDEKTLRWQAKNQWFGSSGFEEVTSYALGLHQKLVASGVDPRSQEYFEQIDARIHSKFPEVFGEDEKNSRTVSSQGTAVKKPTSVVAPATRSSGKRKVELTPSQAALVKKFNLDPQKYAQEVLKLENQNG